jgi:hypothetical protein
MQQQHDAAATPAIVSTLYQPLYSVILHGVILILLLLITTKSSLVIGSPLHWLSANVIGGGSSRAVAVNSGQPAAND